MDYEGRAMIKFIKGLWKKYRRWKCKRQFNALEKSDQAVITYMGSDPDSLIKKGKL